MTKKVEGDILFFSIGTAPITKIVKELNQTISPNVIALPFYKELPQKWKDLAEKTYKIKDFDIHRDDIFLEIKESGSGRKVRKGTYDQVIVVATNIAEASITISNLRYVIDTGYYNSVKYDNIKKTIEVSIVPISEMSRIQRRGRVGRIDNGTVFYMYSKNSRSEIKSPLDIYNSNISNVCFSMMRKSHEEEYFIEPNYDILN